MWLVNHELEKIWKEAAMANMRYWPSIFVALQGQISCATVHLSL
jgi:hypothetical protein